MKKITPTILCLATSLVSSQSFAQSSSKVGSVPMGGFDFTPSLEVGLGYDDNVTQKNLDQISSWSRHIAPEFLFSTTFGVSDFVVGYRLENTAYFSSQDDNSTDHFLTAQVNVELDVRNRITTTVRFTDGHDDRGSNFSIGLSDSLNTPDTFKESAFDIRYTYGTFNSDGRLELNLDISDLNYDDSSLTYLVRNRKISTFGGTFFYRVGAFLDATFDLKRAYVDYKVPAVPNNELDSYTDSTLVGLRWEATAKTSGFAKIGYQTKKFDSALREDFSGIDWNAGLTWEPNDISTFSFRTSADTNETNGEGNFIRSRTYSASWEHIWLERLSSRVRVGFDNERYEGQLIDGFDIRSDDLFNFSGKLNYQFRRWLGFELSYRYNERESNRQFIDFDRNRFLLNAIITL